jgi:hypothetical protein
LKHIACIKAGKNTPFPQNNCFTRIQTSQAFLSILPVQKHGEVRLFAKQIFDMNSDFSQAFSSTLEKHAFSVEQTRLQTFHRHFKAYCLYKSMEKYAFFAEKLFDKNSNFLQAF